MTRSKRITIYIPTQTLKVAKEKAKKYRVSISTLARLSLEVGKKYKDVKDTNEYIKQIFTMYSEIQEKYFKDQTIKTTIKTRLINENYNAKTYVFALVMATDKDKRRMFFKEQTDKYCNDLNESLTKEKDLFFDYNATIRNTTRYVKTNRKYLQRLLERA